MLQIGADTERLLARSLGRVQACVDQVTGVQECLKAGANIAPDGMHYDHTLRVMALLQKELDKVWMIAEHSPAESQADGAEWLLSILRQR